MGPRRAHGGRETTGAVISTDAPAGRPDDAPFEVSVAHGPAPGHVVASVRGMLDAAVNPLLQQALLRALRQAREVLVLDLSGVTFFGSAGVTALVWVSQHPEAVGKRVRVIANSRVVTGPLELTGLLDRLDVSGMPSPATGSAPDRAPRPPG